jgi:hypothetical protein
MFGDLLGEPVALNLGHKHHMKRASIFALLPLALFAADSKPVAPVKPAAKDAPIDDDKRVEAEVRKAFTPIKVGTFKAIQLSSGDSAIGKVVAIGVDSVELEHDGATRTIYREKITWDWRVRIWVDDAVSDIQRKKIDALVANAEAALKKSAEAIERKRKADFDAANPVVVEMEWKKGGFGSVMIADFTVTNKSKKAIKDVVIEVHTFGSSGTEVGRAHRVTITKTWEPGETLTTSGYNVGFVDQMAKKAGGVVIHFTTIE